MGYSARLSTAYNGVDGLSMYVNAGLAVGGDGCIYRGAKVMIYIQLLVGRVPL